MKSILYTIILGIVAFVLVWSILQFVYAFRGDRIEGYNLKGYIIGAFVSFAILVRL